MMILKHGMHFLDQMTIEEMASLFPNVQGTSEINSIVLPETHSSDGCNGSDASFPELLGFGTDEEKNPNSYTEFGGNYTSVIKQAGIKNYRRKEDFFKVRKFLFQGMQ